jgi:glycosyltransferase involved in cell wall biosynthesis
MEEKFRACGAEVAAINYSKGVPHYYRALGALVNEYAITTAHIIFFDYFSAMPWIARLQGIRRVIYEQQNSGVFTATSLKKSLLQLRTRLMTWPVARVIAISDFVKQQLIKSGVAEEKIVVRYLGADTRRFIPDPHARQEWADRFAIGPEEIILSTVSYLRAFKNPHIIVEACRLLAQRGVPFRLIVAGGGELLDELKSLSQKLGIADRTHWLGNWPDPKSLLQASDVFVLASVGEAFGLVLAEAMACGVPVVGSRSGSLLEVVEDGRTGLLATPLDAAAFADAIEQLARDRELRQRMSRQGIERVRQHFTVDQAVVETIRIYESLGVIR